jgi:type IV pilus assembly protein PilW
MSEHMTLQGHTPRRGFTMIELLVTLVIGMAAVIVMLQILSAAEGRKRTTTGGDAAQTNGALALYELQRGLRQAGLGLNVASVIGCNVTLPTGVAVSNMGPVVINHPNIPTGSSGVADANTDTLLVFYGSSNDAPEGDKIDAKLTTPEYTLAGFATASAPSFSVGDNVIAQAAVRPSPCNLTVEPVTGVTGSTVTVGTGVAGTTGGALFNLGPTPTVVVYAVRGGRLTMCNYTVNNCAAATVNPAHWVPMAGNVVSLRAQYGRDTTNLTTTPPQMDGTVDVFDQTAPNSTCSWLRMRAVSVALVARSAQLEKEPVPASAPTWGGAASAPIDLSADANWLRYRYKVFETTVPLRNMAWMGATSGC